MSATSTGVEGAVEDVRGDGAPAVQARATLTDVARLAGVSPKTVSRVYRERDQVAEATREKVLGAARMLRFRPNELARSLRHGSVTNTVAFIIGDLTNPFYFTVAAGLERELADHGMTMILASTEDDPMREQAVAESMIQQRVRALVMVPISSDQSYLEGERQLGTSVVCVDRTSHNLLADAVVLANEEGTAEAVRSLIDAGHRRIAFVCSPAELATHRERLAGYRRALAGAGVHDTSKWECLVDVGEGVIERAVEELLETDDAPTAIFSANNRASMGVLRVLKDHPRTAFIGFDDFEFAEFVGCTVVSYDAEEIGRVAGRLAVDRLDDPTSPPTTVTVPTHLIRRGSGERPPVI